MDQDFNKQEEVQGKVEELPSAFSKRLSGLIEIIKNRPLVTLACLGVIMILLFYGLSESEVKTSMVLAEDRQSREISGIEKAIDPRAKWTAEILNEVKNMQNHLEKLIENKYLETKTKIDDFSQKLESLENPLKETILYDGNDFNNNQKIEDLLDNNFEQSIAAAPTAPVKRLLGYVKRADVELKKDFKDYITTGSFARGVLLTGVVVGTGTNNAASPKPIMIRLVDTAIFSKGYKTEQIKEAILIGSCSGDISSERAKCRLETVSLLNSNGEIIEKPVEGWLIGEDGRPGIKGIVVDRSSDVARMAVLNGVLGGIAQFFQNQATNSIFPVSPITGQQNALKAQDSLKAGVAGTGNALEKLADFAIKRAESMSPVIVVASGRVIDVVFRKGFDLRENKEASKVDRVLPPTTTDYSQDRTNYSNYQNYSGNKVTSFSNKKTKLQERFIKNNDDYEMTDIDLQSEQQYPGNF
ncbi:TraB/VirB10 family protein [Rickettsia endosymbiont of Ixodes scapularis]|uniref:TraB/VirB10 family protein n=1 Tax=Rickettsia endosymbiont of Ixodes scapularis TaxID=444612 RepID=UPI0001A6057F|nr:TraB/VirB10 family protein [Rickettsia endosymbiont of Ixodes scapularis]EER22360.1 F pilus assembly protein TraB [Rickettsia endosymbiont of Ixodes scapularis]